MVKFDVEGVCVFQGSEITGNAVLRYYKDIQETEIIIDLKNVPPGYHGFHIHESGDLREGCASLCSHFNPFNKNHGGPDDTDRHVGDLGNIYAGKNGIVKTTIKDRKVRLMGKNSVIGRSMIIHEDRDDLGKGDNEESLITGNAGKRIACGVIGYSKNSC